MHVCTMTNKNKQNTWSNLHHLAVSVIKVCRWNLLKYSIMSFSKNVSSKEMVKTCFLWLLILSSVHLSSKFHWGYSSRSEVMKNFSVYILIDFHRFFGLFDISLLRRKLATDELATLSTYFKKIVQHFYKVTSILDKFFLKYQGRGVILTPHQKKLPSKLKKPSLIRINT